MTSRSRRNGANGQRGEASLDSQRFDDLLAELRAVFGQQYQQVDQQDFDRAAGIAALRALLGIACVVWRGVASSSAIGQAPSRVYIIIKGRKKTKSRAAASRTEQQHESSTARAGGAGTERRHVQAESGPAAHTQSGGTSTARNTH
eukprot:SAG22_NODE_9217_length_602_cov_1.739563_1_plen_145_part_01